MIPDRVLARQHRRLLRGRRAGRGRRDGVVAAAVPRHGPRRLPVDPDDDRRRSSCRPRRRTSWPSPGNWMQWICDYGGTATAGPNFSWVLATRALRRMEDLDLSTLTLALSGAEPVDPDAVEAFVAAAAPFGFHPGGVFPAFGMAEVAIGGTFPPRGRGHGRATPSTAWCSSATASPSRSMLGPDDEEIAVRRLPLLGTAGARPGDAASSTRTRSRTLPERHVGELLLRGTSVTPGYYKRPDATAALFHDGWLCTGDLAYLLDGELVLCGRIKDVIIVGGRNVFPEDIERAVGALDGVRAGNVIAFGVEGYKGKESVVVVAEVRTDDPDAVRDAIHHRTLEVCGLPPRDVMLVQPGTLPKTSSGKLQRAKCREQYLERGARLAVSRRVSASVYTRRPTSLHDPHARDRGVARPRAVRAHRPGRWPSATRSAADPAFTLVDADDVGHRADRGGARRRPGALPVDRVGGVPGRGRPADREVFADVFYRPGIRAGMSPARRAGVDRRPPRVVVLRDDDAADRGHLRGARSARRHGADAPRSWCSTASRRRTGCAGRPATTPPRRSTAATASSTTRRSPPTTSPSTTGAEGHRARRRLPPRQRHAGDLLRARRRAVRVAARRSRRAPTRTPSATPTRPAPAGGAAATCNVPLAGGHRRRRVPRRARPGASPRSTRSARRW